jgi:hypothetical protein
MPVVYRIPCPHPNCPKTFKSQRGRTYHIRVVHTRSFKFPTGIQEGQLEERGREGHRSDDAFEDIPAANVASFLPPANILDQVGGQGRKNHPYLTGICVLCAMKYAQALANLNN